MAGPALIADIIGNAIIILLLAVGWMLSSDDLGRFTLSLFSQSAARDWKHALDTIGLRLSAYVQGIVINGAVVGVAMGAAVAILGVPYALLLGFVVAVFQAIPMVGAVISGPVVLLVVLATSGWVKMLIVLAIFTVVQILDQNVLSPIIFGQRVQLSFLLIIFSYRRRRHALGDSRSVFGGTGRSRSPSDRRPTSLRRPFAARTASATPRCSSKGLLGLRPKSPANPFTERSRS